MKINEVAKSQQQMKYIYAMRSKYGTKRKAPKNMKWVFDEEWTSGVKMKKLPKKVKKNESRIMDFGSFVNEHYEFEDFTMNDMEFVKELWEEGITEIGQLAIESDLDKATVTQIIYTLKKRGDIKDVSESEVFDEHDEEHSGCGCNICNCVGECNCECCCSDVSDTKSCKWCDKEFTTDNDSQNCCCGDCESQYNNYLSNDNSKTPWSDDKYNYRER